VKLFNPFRRKETVQPHVYPSAGRISIDGQPFNVSLYLPEMVSALRWLGKVPDDKDFWIESPGFAQDVKVEDTDDVMLV